MHITSAADINNLLDAFVRTLEQRDRAATTVRVYRHDVKLFFDWLIHLQEGATIDLRQLGLVELAAFRRYLVHEQGQRPTSINRRIQSLRCFFGGLKERGVIADDPSLALRFLRHAKRQRPLALTTKEVLALLRAAGCSPHGVAKRNLALVQVMLQTGLRVGEVATLRYGDLSLSERSGVVRVRAGKGMKAREVPLNVSVRRALKEYLATLPSLAPDDFVFLSKRRQPLSTRGIQKVIATLGQRAGITRLSVSAHTLRHTFATHYLHDHPDKLIELAGLLGHESLDTTAVYTRPSPKDLADNLERGSLNVFGE